MTKDLPNCLDESPGIGKAELLLPEETPLVGFHGTSQGSFLTSLGLILVDTASPICQQRARYPDAVLLEGIDLFERNAIIEAALSQQEKSRASALEAIL